MGLFSSEPTMEDMMEKSDTLDIRLEIAEKEATIAQRESVIKQLKKEYGKNWMSLLGVDRLTSTETLKSFLTSAKSGMRESGKGVINPLLSPVMPQRRTL